MVLSTAPFPCIHPKALWTEEQPVPVADILIVVLPYDGSLDDFVPYWQHQFSSIVLMDANGSIHVLN